MITGEIKALQVLAKLDGGLEVAAPLLALRSLVPKREAPLSGAATSEPPWMTPRLPSPRPEPLLPESPQGFSPLAAFQCLRLGDFSFAVCTNSSFIGISFQVALGMPYWEKFHFTWRGCLMGGVCALHSQFVTHCVTN